MVIGLPPVMAYANKKLQQEIIPAVLAGDKFICLAISEAHAGSDVQGLKTTAVLTPDKKHYSQSAFAIFPSFPFLRCLFSHDSIADGTYSR